MKVRNGFVAVGEGEKIRFWGKIQKEISQTLKDAGFDVYTNKNYKKEKCSIYSVTLFGNRIVTYELIPQDVTDAVVKIVESDFEAEEARELKEIQEMQEYIDFEKKEGAKYPLPCGLNSYLYDCCGCSGCGGY